MNIYERIFFFLQKGSYTEYIKNIKIQQEHDKSPSKNGQKTQEIHGGKKSKWPKIYEEMINLINRHRNANWNHIEIQPHAQHKDENLNDRRH